MPPAVTIITPTTGSPLLADCVRSVQRQTYANVRHWVVIDGREREEQSARVLANLPGVEILRLPDVTGANGYQGHRIYAAVPHLTNSEFIGYLDEDNWLEPEHVDSLVNLITSKSLQWAYSLRRIAKRDGTFVFNDECNSLGRWPAHDGGYHHIDTGCYLVGREIACEAATVWNRSDHDGTGAADRLLCRHLMSRYPYFHTTGQYTLNYRVGSRHREAEDLDFYRTGNHIYRQMYGRFPWEIIDVIGKNQIHPHLDYGLRPRFRAEFAAHLGSALEPDANLPVGRE